MPIINQWDDEAETIIYGEFSGKWTWDEFFETINKSSEMIGTKPYRCDVIANMRPGTMESAAPALYTPVRRCACFQRISAYWWSSSIR